MPMRKETWPSSLQNSTRATAKSSPMATVGTLPAVAKLRYSSFRKAWRELGAPASPAQQRSDLLRSPQPYQTTRLITLGDVTKGLTLHSVPSGAGWRRRKRRPILPFGRAPSGHTKQLIDTALTWNLRDPSSTISATRLQKC